MMNTFMSQSNEKHCDISALSLGYDDDLELSSRASNFAAPQSTSRMSILKKKTKLNSLPSVVFESSTDLVTFHASLLCA